MQINALSKKNWGEHDAWLICKNWYMGGLYKLGKYETGKKSRIVFSWNCISKKLYNKEIMFSRINILLE